jgi:uncharacterized protein YegP (UPF0339 family)
MKWLKNKLRNWVNSDEVAIATASNKIRVSDEPDVDGLRFTIMRANGGIILQSRRYDHRTDRNEASTYIITDEEPYAERIGQIVSMEILKS